MEQSEKINKAVESFEDWQAPWKFIDTVASSSHFKDHEKLIINPIWAEVTSAEYWQLSDLQACAVIAKEALTKKFPWLSDQACNNFVNAASYQWR